MIKLEEALQFLLNVIKNGSLAAIQNEAMLASRVLEEYRAAPDPEPEDEPEAWLIRDFGSNIQRVTLDPSDAHYSRRNGNDVTPLYARPAPAKEPT